MKLWTKVSAFFRREKLDAEMAEEMRAHLELQTAEHVKRGMSADDARYAARRAFGGVEQIKERARDQRGWVGLEQFAQDIRFAARGLRKNPGFTIVAALTLAFGIGVNTSMFTALRSMLFRELPYPESERLVQVFRTLPHSGRGPHSPANFLQQQAENPVFERMAAMTSRSFNLAEPGQPPEPVSGLLVTADFFPLLGVQPALGRVFTPDEDRPGASNVAVIDHRSWVRRFAQDPNIVGRTLRLDGDTVTILGVMPAAFRDRQFASVEMWRPIACSDAQRGNRGGNYLNAFGRLKPGVSLAQAQTALELLAGRHVREHPEANAGSGLRLVGLADSMDPRGQRALWLTMALAGFVLLIACANLANLQFARTARRTRELAIRGALGATRSRLLRQLLAESLLIALLGGLLGLLLAQWANNLLNRQLSPEGVPALTLNLGVLGFALAASMLAGFAFGLLPAWLASRTSASEAMKQGARGATGDRSRNRLQHGLIVVEVALALVLLAGAGLVVRGLQRFAQQNPGWSIDGLTVGTFSLPEKKYGGAARQRAFLAALADKLANHPGVERVALAWSLPVRAFNTSGSFAIEGRPPPPPGHAPMRFMNAVTPGYFATLRMTTLAGRDFAATDTAEAPPVTIVNETMARTFWPNESPLGQRIDGVEIVGVVNDVRFVTDPSAPATRFQTYRPLAQDPRSSATIALRGSITAGALRRAVAELDADLPVNNAGPAQTAMDRAVANFRLASWLLSSFGVLGLLLASLGIYGVIAGFVVQRTNEIGVRMALGAQMRDVLWLVVGKGLRLTLLGVALGVAGSFGVAPLIAALISEAGSNDPLAIAAAAVVLTTVALLACWLPARRAAKVDPMMALRSE